MPGSGGIREAHYPFCEAGAGWMGRFLPTPRHAMTNAATPKAPRIGPQIKVGVQSTGTLYGVIRMFTMMLENMLVANKTSRAITHPPALKLSRMDHPRRAP